MINPIADRMRCFLSLLQPLTGDRSTGTVTVTATGADVTLPHDRWLAPILGGEIRPRMAFKLVANPATADGSWTVTAGGTSIPLQSVCGGLDKNLVAGTVLRWVGAGYEVAVDAGVAATVVVEAPGMTGGANASGYAGIASIGIFEQMQAPWERGLLKARLSELPAVMLCWTGMDQAEGSAGDRMVMAGYGQNLVRQLFTAYVICNRHDDDPVRRDEGLQLMIEVVDALSWQQDVDGVVFSTPEALCILTATRVASTPQLYIYAINFRVTHTISKEDRRVWSTWVKTRLQNVKDGVGVVDATWNQ